VISVLQLGTLDYSTALDLQRSLVRLRQAELLPDTLLLLEHTPVITLGRNARREHLLATPAVLRQKGIEVFDCDHGGDITLHGPGQLVGYPIFDLRGFSPRVGAVEFVRRLEEVLIRACAAFAISAHRIPGLTGVWTKPGVAVETGTPAYPPIPAETGAPARTDLVPAKIAAIGVHISRGVTSHGFALNVNTDLDDFNLIVPCGLASRPVTSIAHELGHPLALDDVARSLAQHMADVFSTPIRWVDELAELTGGSVGVPARPPADLRRVSGEEDIYLG
jgi:lipoyl(octanoyl) transferase